MTLLSTQHVHRSLCVSFDPLKPNEQQPKLLLNSKKSFQRNSTNPKETVEMYRTFFRTNFSIITSLPNTLEPSYSINAPKRIIFITLQKHFLKTNKPRKPLTLVGKA